MFAYPSSQRPPATETDVTPLGRPSSIQAAPAAGCRPAAHLDTRVERHRRRSVAPTSDWARSVGSGGQAADHLLGARGHGVVDADGGEVLLSAMDLGLFAAAEFVRVD